MSAAILVAVLIAVIVALLFRMWWLQDELERAQARHARPRPLRPAAAERPDGAAPAPSPGAAPADPEDNPAFWDDKLDALSSMGGVPPAQAADHADALWQASEPYLPGAEFLPRRPKPGSLAARTVPVAHTDDAPPWETATGVQPAIDPDEAAEQDRARYIVSQIQERVIKSGHVTLRDLEEVRDSLRAAPSTAGPELAKRVIA